MQDQKKIFLWHHLKVVFRFWISYFGTEKSFWNYCNFHFIEHKETLELPKILSNTWMWPTPGRNALKKEILDQCADMGPTSLLSKRVASKVSKPSGNFFLAYFNSSTTYRLWAPKTTWTTIILCQPLRGQFFISLYWYFLAQSGMFLGKGSFDDFDPLHLHTYVY